MKRIALLTVPFLALACTDAEQATLLEPPAISAAVTAKAVMNQELADLRRATAPFHNFDKAVAAGYGTPLTGCDEQLPDGAQGIHYGNLALIGDGVVSLLEPEILQYEPQASGHLRLVGIEYIAFTDDPPPDLLGQPFHGAPGFWALHVWAWRNNPSGMFVDWNPKVSCEHAT